tara:strand:- start:271 stop:957 length:687 start_codon:yes stop_codon:yes gene_type:complete
MKKYLLIITLLCLFSFNCFAATGSATVYKVTMIKVELCPAGDSTCASPTVIGSGSQTIDIASLTAGADAAAFASTTGLPFGITYQFLRVTISRSFSLKGTVDVSGNNCTTDSASAGTATALHTGTLNDTSVEVEQTLYLADAGSYGSDSSITMSYGSPTYARSMSVGSPSATEMQLIYQLGTLYQVGLIAPKIQVKFNTSTALGAGRDGSGACLMWAMEPNVAISITD